MKNLILMLTLFFGCLSYSQSIVKSSIDSGGASSSNGNIQILYSFGEINVQESEVGNIILSEGFISSGETIPLSIKESELLLGVSLYPNPTKGILSINGDTSKIISIEIYSLLGAKLMTVKNEFREINLKEFENAVYLVKLNTINASKTIKIIKQ
ncbi:T9SS type A sorting domain-containing protein [Flavobacteriaceae bacterium AH-315-B10]|nr:T9SS type A sorting domain-containing protein [Flavobacteriaceae bacterium AH-315-B10]